ncbi:hypothetical protein QBC35DRAFT_225882 [Podospora australis]|uniref:Uncharacterized protein n=1 Tax=Podospora australis TaxID=1536484 RepID=A0AAN7ANE4_9PEZI|nr:hypothetical protein QBC35DRAFT_225882 [Podospora australis]
MGNWLDMDSIIHAAEPAEIQALYQMAFPEQQNSDVTHLRSDPSYLDGDVVPGEQPAAQATMAKSTTKEAVDGRGSFGSSASSVPGMVEDQDSELSGEDDEYHTTGTDMWDRIYWQAPNPTRKAPRPPAVPDYPALISPMIKCEKYQHIQTLTTGQEVRSPKRNRSASTKSQTTPSPSSTLTACPEKDRPHTAKSAAKPSYSLFPVPPRVSSQNTTPVQRTPPVVPRIQTTNLSMRGRQWSEPVIQTRSVATSRKSSRSGVSTSRPPSSSSRSEETTKLWRISGITADSGDPTPILERYARGDFGFPSCPSSASASTTSIPFLLRQPPTPPRSSPVSPRDRSAHTPSKQPLMTEDGRRPSFTGLRSLSLSRFSTRSSPALANLAKSQTQPDAPPPLPTMSPKAWLDLSTRPLPPLPRCRPNPPNISIFEVDSDDEDVSSPRTGSGASSSFARRLKRAFVPSSSRKEKGKEAERPETRLSSRKRSIATPTTPSVEETHALLMKQPQRRPGTPMALLSPSSPLRAERQRQQSCPHVEGLPKSPSSSSSTARLFGRWLGRKGSV